MISYNWKQTFEFLLNVKFCVSFNPEENSTYFGPPNRILTKTSIFWWFSLKTQLSLSYSPFRARPHTLLEPPFWFLFLLVDEKRAQDPTTLKKRRGVIHASITRLFTRLKDLESKADQPTTLDLTWQMSQKLESLDSDFKLHQYALIYLIDDIESMLKEQDILDGHDGEMATLSTCIKRQTQTLISPEE